MSPTRISLLARIGGRVQGVGYRDWTRGRAVALGLDGWVRNRADGTVEAVFAGPEDAVASMLERCHRGPPAARVDTVDSEPASDPGAGFEVRATA